MFFIFFMFPYNLSYNRMFNYNISYNNNITKKNTPSFTTRSIYNTNLNKIINITYCAIVIVMFTYLKLRITNIKSNTTQNTMQIYNFYLIYTSILIIINIIIFNITKMMLMIILYIIIMYIKIMIVKLC